MLKMSLKSICQPSILESLRSVRYNATLTGLDSVRLVWWMRLVNVNHASAMGLNERSKRQVLFTSDVLSCFCRALLAVRWPSCLPR